MAVLLKPLLAEFAAYLARTGLERRLQIAHQVFVGLGLLGCLGVLGAHFGLGGEDGHATFVARNLLLLLSMLNLFACTLVIGWAHDAALRRLQAPSDSVEERAGQVATHIVHRDRLLLGMAIVGQILALVAAKLHVRLLSIDAPLVILNLLPTAQLAYIGWREVPSRARLMYLYKLVALYNERARILAERQAVAASQATATDQDSSRGTSR